MDDRCKLDKHEGLESGQSVSSIMGYQGTRQLSVAVHVLRLSGAVAGHVLRLSAAVDVYRIRLSGAVVVYGHVLRLSGAVAVHVLMLSGALAVHVLRLPVAVAVHVLRLPRPVAVHVLWLSGAVAAVATAGSRKKGVEFAPCVYASFYTSDIVSYTYKLACGLLGMLYTFVFPTCMVYCSYIHHKFSFSVKMTSPARKTVHAKYCDTPKNTQSIPVRRLG